MNIIIHIIIFINNRHFSHNYQKEKTLDSREIGNDNALKHHVRDEDCDAIRFANGVTTLPWHGKTSSPLRGSKNEYTAGS